MLDNLLPEDSSFSTVRLSLVMVCDVDDDGSCSITTELSGELLGVDEILLFSLFRILEKQDRMDAFLSAELMITFTVSATLKLYMAEE